MDAIPQGFTRRADGGAVVVLRDDVAAALLAAGIGRPDALETRASAGFEGRGHPFAVDVDGVGRVFVRQYLHGGALRGVTGELYQGDGRFLAELTAHVEAARAGAPVAEALGFVSHAGGLGLRR